MRIDKRKSWFWHWFVMTSWKDRDRSVYEMPILAKYEFPKYELALKCPSYSTRYEAEVFYRHRAMKHKNCPEYWGAYSGPKTMNNMEVEQ